MDRMNRIGNRMITQARGDGNAKRFAKNRECPYIGQRLSVPPPGNGLYADAAGLTGLFRGKPFVLSPFLYSFSNFPGFKHRYGSSVR